MPTYSYRCTQCHNAFDIVQLFTDDSLTECPSCQGVLRKVFSAIGVSFNGSGFYRTDSRSSAKTGQSSESGNATVSTGSGAPASGSGSSDSGSSAVVSSASPGSSASSSGSASGS